MTEKKNLVIIGGGPAGLAAAKAAYDAGERDILVLEREERLGGILNQCIHNGFGLHTFKEELTGPEYAARYEREVAARGIECKTGTTVLSIKDRQVTAVGAEGLKVYDAKAVILACGCRERPRGAINIAGCRAAGVFSAGTAQKLINIDGLMPGREVVILGSGDIGLIMARRMTFQGAKVKAVVELMPYSSGLNRNIVQCLDDFGIPLKFSHTVVGIKGKKRVSSVIVAAVDKDLRPVAGTEEEIPCDTLLLSVGLLPENEVAKTAGVELSPVTSGAVVDDGLMTSCDGVFACGNVLHVHDLVDFVSEESERAGASAAAYIRGKSGGSDHVTVSASGGVRYAVPQKVNRRGDGSIGFKMRVGRPAKDVKISLFCDGREVAFRKKRIVTPGEMETLVLTAEQSDVLRGAREAEIRLTEV